MKEIWVPSLGWEDPLEKGMATHSSILAWRIPWTEEPGGLQYMGSQRVGCDWVHTHTHTHTQDFESGSEEDVVFLWLNFPSKCGWVGNWFFWYSISRRLLTNIYLAASGLSCSTWDLGCITRALSLRRAGLVAPWQVGSLFLDQGLNPHPLHCKVDS